MWRILIVDDDSTTRTLVKEILKTRAVCTEAHNGMEALELYNQSIVSNEPFDCMLLDIMMPDIYGLEVSRIIRKREAFEHIQKEDRLPIILITAYTQLFKAMFEDNLCNGYVKKPFTAEHLIATMDKAIAPEKEG